MKTLRLLIGIGLLGLIVGCDKNTPVTAVSDSPVAATMAVRTPPLWESLPTEQFVSQWVDSASQCYHNAELSYLELDAKTQEFLDTPSQTLLRQLQNGWRSAHQHFVACGLFQQPVSRDWKTINLLLIQLDSWPIMGGYIDAIPGYPDTGIINDSSIDVSLQTLIEQHQITDTTDVTVGFHAIEFLLWGENLQRSYTEYLSYAPEISEFGFDTNPENRRRTVLRESTSILVTQTRQLQSRWNGGVSDWSTTLLQYSKEQQASYLYQSFLAFLNNLNRRFFDPTIQGDLFLLRESPYSYSTRDGVNQSLQTFQSELTQWMAIYRASTDSADTLALLDTLALQLQTLMASADQLPPLNASTLVAWQQSAAAIYGHIQQLTRQLTTLGRAVDLPI